MSEDLIQLPDLKEIQELLVTARRDIDAEVEQEPELADEHALLVQVMAAFQELIAKAENNKNVSMKEKISIAAHLNFLQCLLEDFFFFDEDEDDLESEFDLEFSEEEK